LKMRKMSVTRIAGIALIMLFTCLIVFSCARDAVTYCPFCGQAGIEEVSNYDISTGETTITYKCTYQECGVSFGAGLVQ